MEEIIMQICSGDKSEHVQKKFIAHLIAFAKKQNVALLRKRAIDAMKYSSAADFKTIKEYFNYIYIETIQAIWVGKYYDFIEGYYSETDDIDVFIMQEIDEEYNDLIANKLAEIF